MKYKKNILIIFLVIFLLPLQSLAYYHDTSPIQWREYGQEAFDEALEKDKPVMMLITAIWCYWCHVYRDETLHDPEVVQYINNNFIPVFVDADKRQDLTRQYLAGGWPSTVFFSPDGREISRINGHIKKPDLLSYLQKVTNFFAFGDLPEDYNKANSILRTSKVIPGRIELKELTENLPKIIYQNFDSEFGGFGTGQKFPTAIAWDYLLSAYEETQDKRFLDASIKTLDSMYHEQFIDDWDKPLDLGVFNGLRKHDEERKFQGIFDPVEGGFFRYATSRDWSIPHYEKMLDVNAQLIQLYSHAYAITKNPKYKELVEKTADYIFGNLYDTEKGGFYGSQDAGKELYYRQRPEIRLSDATKEKRPVIDFSKYADWNAPMILALFYASDVFENEQYRDAAIISLDFFRNEMMTADGINHLSDDEGARLNGLLLDNAYMALAFIEGFKKTGDESYKKSARALIDFSIKRLYNGNVGGFIERNSTDKHLYVGEGYILETIPYSGNSVMALALAKAYEITENQDYLDKGNEIIGYFSASLGSFEYAALQAEAAEIILDNSKSLQQSTSIIESSEVVQLKQNLNITWILFLIAFIIGVLSFLSPCTLPILPAYFAYSINAGRGKVLRNALAFFLGLLIVFSILGMTATVIGAFLSAQSFKLSVVFGLIIAIFGIMMIFGKGFAFKGIKINPNTSNTFSGNFVFGIAFGIGWSPCVGPLLASIFIIASQSATAYIGGMLLGLYAIGLALPLILLSLYIDKLDRNSRLWKILEGKEFVISIGGKNFRFHTTGIISGILLITLGILLATGYLYSLNQIISTTSFQVWIYGLEEKLLGLIS